VSHHRPKSRIVSESEVRRAYQLAMAAEQAERVSHSRAAFRTAGITVALVCGLLLNAPNLSIGTELALDAIKDLRALLMV
jgi:hypothetical protein